MTLKQYKAAYLKHAEEENCLPDSDFTLTEEEMAIVENAKIIWSVHTEHSDYKRFNCACRYDGMVKILDNDGKVLWSHVNAWHDDYCPYIVNAICATKKQVSASESNCALGRYAQGKVYINVDKIEGTAEFYI